MKISILTITVAGMLTIAVQAGTTVTYTYDKLHRLTSADYSAEQSDAHVTYQYDAANNLDLYVAVTEGQYLNSFLLYLSWMPTRRSHAAQDVAEISWPEVWENIERCRG